MRSRRASRGGNRNGTRYITNATASAGAGEELRAVAAAPPATTSASTAHRPAPPDGCGEHRHGDDHGGGPVRYAAQVRQLPERDRVDEGQQGRERAVQRAPVRGPQLPRRRPERIHARR